jgi:hypothetical protein
MPTQSAKSRAAELLGKIHCFSEDLLDLGHDVMALPAEAERVLEMASRDEPVDTDELTLALEAAERLENTLFWQWLQATAALFADYTGTTARMAERREARQAKAKAAGN